MIKNLFLLAVCVPWSLVWADGFYKDVKIKKSKNFESIYKGLKNKEKRNFDNIYKGLKSTGDAPINESYTSRDKTGVLISEDAKSTESLAQARSGKNIDDFSSGQKFYQVNYFLPSGISVNSNLFQTIFKSGEKSASTGPIIFSYEEKLFGESFGASWISHYGIGYFQGRGKFQSDGTESETKFTLWMLPVELGANLLFHQKGWFKLTAGGGASLWGVIQSRNDFDEGEDGKNISQFGLGYFLEANASFCISKVLPSWRRELFNMYDIGQIYFNLKLRTQHIDIMQNDLVISGVTVGAGLTFELF